MKNPDCLVLQLQVLPSSLLDALQVGVSFSLKLCGLAGRTSELELRIPNRTIFGWGLPLPIAWLWANSFNLCPYSTLQRELGAPVCHNLPSCTPVQTFRHLSPYLSVSGSKAKPQFQSSIWKSFPAWWLWICVPGFPASSRAVSQAKHNPLTYSSSWIMGLS